jgi:hypothetical protein
MTGITSFTYTILFAVYVFLLSSVALYVTVYFPAIFGFTGLSVVIPVGPSTKSNADAPASI